jgi:CheY-like chemotaxis protein/nitrogen-specific signal transduction histidine kinase
LTPILAEGACRGAVLIFCDQIQRKQAEKELIEAREQAEAISRLKSTFLNNMSHEIRTPLTAIIGFSAILAEETSLEQRELVDLIEQSGKRLLNTLNTVLDLSMLESGSLSLENDWFDLVEAAQEKVMEMQPFAWEKNLDLNLATPAPRMPVYLDRACLDRILTHLIDNAVKFTHKGVVTVALAQEAGRVHIRVEDTGVGISQSFQPYLFDDFKQESTGLTRSHEGVGLGLAVTRRMLELMGGTVVVESQKGQGSAFDVSFAQPLLLNGKKVTAPQAHPSKPCILVVEDTPEIEMLVEYMLSDFYEVATVSHEAAALALARDRRFDLVLMDINLGSARTGVDVMEALREMPGYRDVPIVAMTAYALLEDRTRFLQAGFDGYLSKPFTLQQAMDTIGQLLLVDGSA